MNRQLTVTLKESLKLYANLKFEEKGIIRVKAGETVTFEETGKVYQDPNGEYKTVMRLRRNTRNYYTIGELMKEAVQ